MAAQKNHVPNGFSGEVTKEKLLLYFIPLFDIWERICLDIITTVDVFIILFIHFAVPLDQIPIFFSFYAFSIEFDNS